jgi:hypothetical protein
MQLKTMLSCLGVMVLCVAAPSWAGGPWTPTPPDAAPSDVAVAWFDLLYDVVKAEQITPPPASRIYGVAAVALYEALVPGSLQHRSLVGQLNAFGAVPQPAPRKRYHWPAVANAALASTVRGLFPTATAHSLQTINTLGHQFADTFQARLPAPVYTRSVTQGQAVADAVLAWASTDGSAIFAHCAYTPPGGPGLWEPTPPAFTPTPLQPCWGQLRPFVLTSGGECAPPPPPAYSEDPASEFYALATDVYTINLNLTAEQRTIAQYWADNAGSTGTPPGHWIAIVGQIARTHGLALMAAAEAYTRVGLAVADAFINRWC